MHGEVLPLGEANHADLATVRTREFLGAVAAALEAVEEAPIVAAADAVHDCLLRRGTVFILGNGGSCATASHLVTDLSIAAHAAGLCGRVTALHDNQSLITALANDVSFAESAVILLEINASAGDVLIVFSGSGRSPNLVNAARFAQENGVLTVLVGSTGAPSDFPAAHTIPVASDRYSVIEAAHSAVAHALSDLVRSYTQVDLARCSDR